MAYTPPNFDAVNFTFNGTIYTPPNFDAVNFVFGEDNISYLGDTVKFGDNLIVVLKFQYSFTDTVKFSDLITPKLITSRNYFTDTVKFSDLISLGNYILSWTKRVKVLNTEIVSFHIKIYKTSTEELLREDDVIVTDVDDFTWQYVYTRQMNETDNGTFTVTDLTFAVAQVSDEGYTSPYTFIYV